jgi:hypothetical protein
MDTFLVLVVIIHVYVLDFWSKLCGMKVYSKAEKTAVLGYADDQVKLFL